MRNSDGGLFSLSWLSVVLVPPRKRLGLGGSGGGSACCCRSQRSLHFKGAVQLFLLLTPTQINPAAGRDVGPITVI